MSWVVFVKTGTGDTGETGAMTKVVESSRTGVTHLGKEICGDLAADR